MCSERHYRSSYDCILRIKGVTPRPILFSQMKRAQDDAELNIDDVLADDRIQTESDHLYEEKLDSIMSEILDWAIYLLSETNQIAIRSVFYEGKTVKQVSEEQCVTIFAVYKRLERSYPSIKSVVIEELNDLDPDTRTAIIRRFGLGGIDA